MDTIRAEIHTMIETAIHDHNLASRAWVKGLGATDNAIINELTDHISKLHNRITILEKIDEVTRELLKRVDILEKQVRKLFALTDNTKDKEKPPSPAAQKFSDILLTVEIVSTLESLISKIEQRSKT